MSDSNHPLIVWYELEFFGSKSIIYLPNNSAVVWSLKKLFFNQILRSGCFVIHSTVGSFSVFDEKSQVALLLASF